MNYVMLKCGKSLRFSLFITIIFAGIIFIGQPLQASASQMPEIENTTVSGQYTNDFNFSHTGTSSDSDLLAVVLVSHRYDALGGVVGVTYGGQAMTLASTTGQGLAYVYYLTNAATGTQTVSLDILPAAAAASRPVIATALTITGADMSDPIDSLARYDSASDNTIDATITTTQNNVLVLDVLGASTGSNPSPSGTGHVSIQDGTYDLGIYGFGYKEATSAGEHTLGWTTTNQTNDVGLALIGIAPKAPPKIENTTVSSQYSNDFNFSHTGTSSDSNLLAVVLVAHRYGAPGGIVGVTYGGQAMTLAQSTPQGLSYIYYLANAATGTQTVSVDVLAAAAALSPSRKVIATALTITDANMIDPVDNSTSYDGASDNSIDTSITTTQDDVLIVDVLSATTGTDPSPSGTGHVSIQDGTHSLGIHGFGYKEATSAGGHTLGWTTTNQTNDFGLAVVGIAPY